MTTLTMTTMNDPAIALDYESSKLLKLINNKKEYLKKLDAGSTQAKYLISEIEFLENDILPVLLNRNFYVNDIVLPLELSISKLASLQPNLREKVTGILYYHQFRIPTKESEFVMCTSNLDNINDIIPSLMVNTEDMRIYEVLGTVIGKYPKEIPLFLTNYKSEKL